MMNSSRTTLLLVILSFFLFASVCEAAERPRMRAFSIHDTDKDGLLSKEEYLRFSEKLRQRSQADDRQMRRHLPPLSFGEIDNNNDGYITKDEMLSALNDRLEKHRRYRYRGGRW